MHSEAAPGVYVYTPQGKELPTNVAFGYGDDDNLLCLASGKSLYTIRLAKMGYSPA